MMFCSHSSMAHRETEITHWIASSAGAKQTVCIFIRLCSNAVALADCQEKSRRFIYLCQFQTVLFFARFLHSVCIGRLLLLFASMSSLVQWLCRLRISHICSDANFLTAPYMGNVRASVCRFPDACIRFIPLAMRGIDTLVLYIAFQLFEY